MSALDQGAHLPGEAAEKEGQEMKGRSRKGGTGWSEPGTMKKMTSAQLNVTVTHNCISLVSVNSESYFYLPNQKASSALLVLLLPPNMSSFSKLLHFPALLLQLRQRLLRKVVASIFRKCSNNRRCEPTLPPKGFKEPPMHWRSWR